ncbi:protein GLUTAMINE DUMPER 3 [Tripterygium wilfordii]|uniref:Protein GLUTAMINE DUMPER 3 n=1 Tax=Tripterygium wilfordii TaxID=458696 RepID=A0A7J7BVK3_TRIWF|nr:protein GLUTAMINE DUMPER 3-like [Tripterygium wilfordii]KAF5725913.1 protein GLUTAMINE DUMPER 3 [Tripterygium wilfordii]
MAAREPFNVTGTAGAAATPQHSPWHSPVPYLFGGLAAMLGLIAFALLILACSYWKLSGYLEGGEGSGDGERDLEAGEGGKGDDVQKVPAVMEEKILVIMAGQMKPTYLATPMSSRTWSFGDGSEKSCCCDEKQCEKEKSGDGGVELVKQEGDVQVRIGSNNESSDQTH